jgi:hypothetical protein
MEMAGKQFSPFMEKVVQPCLTACATMSYSLWKWLASSSLRLWKRLCNHVLQLVQPCLTVYGNGWQAVLSVYGKGCATMSYSLCNHVLQFMEMAGKQFSPFMEKVLEVVRAKISGYIKSYATLKIGLHTDLGNSELKKLHLNKNWWNCDRNLRQSTLIGRKVRRNSCPLKQNSAPAARLSQKLTLRLVIILSPLRAREKN